MPRRTFIPPASPPRLGPPAPAPIAEPAELEKLLGYVELSAWLGIRIPTLRSMVSRGTIPSLRLGPRLCRFERAAIERWLEAARVGNGGES